LLAGSEAMEVKIALQICKLMGIVHVIPKPILYRSRGLFAGTIGVERLLRLFDKYNIKTTFFIPGHSLETYTFASKKSERD
jgi:hypothetical protein